MKPYAILSIIAIALVLGGFIFVEAQTSDKIIEQEKTTTGCSNCIKEKCSLENNCGQENCQAKQNKPCGCNK